MDEDFFLDQDHSCHWYIVPEKNRKEWNEWREIDEDDERAWEAPEFASPLSRHPNKVIFKHPQVLS